MEIELYNKHGNYNSDGYFIEDHNKWDYYYERPELYKKNKMKAKLSMLIPICGIILASEIYDEMGLSLE